MFRVLFMLSSLAIVLSVVVVAVDGTKGSTNCRTIDSKKPNFRSIVFSEAHGSGLGAQLFVYALMSQLRHEYNFDTFVSRECRAILSNVFTVTRDRSSAAKFLFDINDSAARSSV